MKLTQILLAGAVVLAASGAMAYDLDHPFWGPAQGQFASDTVYKFGRTNGKGILREAEEAGVNQYAQQISEQISYGITDNWTVSLDLAKDWGKYNYDGAHDKGNQWTLGTTYNVINDGRRFAQVGTYYGQYKGEYSEMAKIYGFKAKGGVNMGKVTPYAEAWWGNTLNQGSYNDAWMGLRAAAYTNLTQRVGLDAGLSYDHQTGNTYVVGSYKLDATVSYLLCENVSLRAFGDYLLHDHQKKGEGVRTQREYTLGLGAKVAF